MTAWVVFVAISKQFEWCVISQALTHTCDKDVVVCNVFSATLVKTCQFQGCSANCLNLKIAII